MSTQKLADAFVAGNFGRRIHNAWVDVADPDMPDYSTLQYKLQGHVIAERYINSAGRVVITGSWCGYYTQTTARHLKAIVKACVTQGLRGEHLALSAAQERAKSTPGIIPTFVIV